MSRSCFPSFPVCVFKFSSHYINNIIFIDNSLGPLATESLCILCHLILDLSHENIPEGFIEKYSIISVLLNSVVWYVVTSVAGEICGRLLRKDGEFLQERTV
jgi:hypothetical protein